MREILFRGKRVDNGEWVYGYFVKHGEKCFINTGTIKYKDGAFIGMGLNETIATPEEYKVDESTLGQFTSVYDKNGNNVFTGDIIDYNGKKIIVYFMCCHYSAYDLKGTYYQLPLITGGGGVVIGNIHDNPELLKEELC